MSEWKKRIDTNDVTECFEQTSGCTKEELMHPQKRKPDSIGGLTAAAEAIREAIFLDEPICVVGDYDADGVTASAILYLLLKDLGKKPKIRLPKRKSEGYGFSDKIITELENDGFHGLLLTVDNGIAACDTIRQAKEDGWTVVVLDHHLPGDQLPPADVLVDQHVPGKCGEDGFRYYCGAGLAYKLAEMMLGDDVWKEELLCKMRALAAIGTVADVMPLQDDNRVIVKEGLRDINEGRVTGGLASILEAKGFEHIVSTDIGFQIAPIINAPGRLIDDGARLPCAVLSTDKPVPTHANKLLELNEERKRVVAEVVENLKEPGDNDMPYILAFNSCEEGLLGLIAGNLAEKYHRPTFVVAPADDDGSVWKGSARSCEGVNIKERMDRFGNTMLRYGGHAGAAGFSVAFDKMSEFVREARLAFSDVPIVKEEALEYDLEIDACSAVNLFDAMDKFQPFGEGCPEPIVRINHIKVKGDYNTNPVRFMSEGKHVKITEKDFTVLWFHHGADFEKIKDCDYIDAVGRLNKRYSQQYGDSLQLVAMDIRMSEK